jgi:hypothetical protein
MSSITGGNVAQVRPELQPREYLEYKTAYLAL